MFGTGGGFAPSGLGQNESTSQFGGPSSEVRTPRFGGQHAGATNPAAPLPNAGEGVAAASLGDCYYFLQGTCTKVSLIYAAVGRGFSTKTVNHGCRFPSRFFYRRL